MIERQEDGREQRTGTLTRLALCSLLMVGLAGSARALETTWIYAVQLSAAVQADPARVELSWPADHLPVTSYTVQRKAPGEKNWGAGVTLPGDATTFADENVAPGHVYEYQVTKHGAGYTGYGYISAALDAPLADARGKLVLVIDDTVAAPLGAELARLERDLLGEGWNVVRAEVPRDANPADVKARIKAEYDADRDQVRAVLLFGHVPFVRSGNLNPDGHVARPVPSDAYYGDMDGDWPDSNGDGVLDPTYLPSDVELEVGRVDFADLPGTYAAQPYPGEIELLRRYLEKNHNYRQAITRPALRALVGGLNDAGGQAYAAAGYRSFAPLVGAPNIVTADLEPPMPAEDRWINRLARDDYVLAFGFGAGSNFTVAGLGTHGPYSDAWASDFVDLKAKGTFYLMFGSWFVEWQNPDNLLRTILAAPDYGLAAVWSGRPHVFLHPMGAGETIGYAVRLSQNNDGKLYQNQVQRNPRGVHLALLGDPTLRLYPVAPPSGATASAAGLDVAIAWAASKDDNVIGYHVYRATNPSGPFTRLTSTPVADTRFTDANHAGESATYLVRAIAAQTSPSGTFLNPSEGAFVNYSTGGARLPAGSDVVWLDDALPAGAVGLAVNDHWNWVTGDAQNGPASGQLAHVADIAPGLHHHFFVGATAPLVVNTGDTLYAYVFLDPANLPRAIQITWCAENWEHRAYWGANAFTEGTDGGPGRHYMGPLPAAGQWVRLEVPASAVDMEGRTATGMGYTLFDGRASWDRAGKITP